ncbi:MAG: His/Gly/Thr/Pro-type tRNA ligase C-terminal domain-containing protein, partial [Flavobacteriales bacterium]
RLLQALASLGGVTEAQFTDWTVAVDKLDKVGVDGVIREFAERGLPQSAAAQLPELVALRDHKDPMAALDALATLLEGQTSGETALASVRDLIARAVNTGVKLDTLRMDPLLARGLDYYTGAIFEVTVDEAPVGSICGGGRYDDLTGIFGWKGMSGVGISFGADRIEDVLNHFDAWPAMASDGLDAMVVQMEQGELPKELQATQALREAGLSAELYPDPAKLKKQFKYANDRNVRWVLVLGESELASGQVMLKDMQEGAQEAMTVEEAVQKIQSSRTS